MKKAFLVVARVLLIAATICTLMFAFYQSSLPPMASNEVSDGVSGALEMFISSKTQIGKFIHKNIREIAHFSEFFLLGILVSLYCSLVSTDNIRISRKKIIFVLCSFGFGTLCGCVDEIVQAFSSRNPDVLDVLLDTAGYLFSAFTVYAIYFLINLVLNLIRRQKGKHRA